MQVLRPTVEWEIAGVLTQLAKDGRRAEILGAGTKATVGRLPDADITIELRYMRGFNRLEPLEQIAVAMAGTTVGDAARELADRDLMLPFEPVDLGPMLGHQPWLGTLGGIFSTNVAGSRRIVAGDATMALMGATIVTSRGEIVKIGGPQASVRRQPDLLRAVAGSWGTLSIMTEVSFRLERRPEDTATLLVADLPEEIAVEAMSEALASNCGVTGATHIDASLTKRFLDRLVQSAGTAVTALRLEGPSRILPQRVARLRSIVASYGDCSVLGRLESEQLWLEFQSLVPFQLTNDPVWRILVPPSKCASVLRGIHHYFPCRALLDWGGGLIWLEVLESSDAGAADIRRVLASAGGHATLIRADHDVRHAVDCFQPMSGVLEQIAKDLKTAFDPRGILNRGRCYAGW